MLQTSLQTVRNNSHPMFTMSSAQGSSYKVESSSTCLLDNLIMYRIPCIIIVTHFPPPTLRERSQPHLSCPAPRKDGPRWTPSEERLSRAPFQFQRHLLGRLVRRQSRFRNSKRTLDPAQQQYSLPEMACHWRRESLEDRRMNLAERLNIWRLRRFKMRQWQDTGKLYTFGIMIALN